MSGDQATREQEFFDLMMRFRLDVTAATNSLVYTLYGINLVHRQAIGLPANAFPTPDYPPLRVVPHVASNRPFSERTAPGGLIEQRAFKAWVTEVYDDIWESTYRSKLRKAFDEDAPRGVPMETDPMGDLKWVRHDLIHNRSVASRCDRCKILKWFERGEQMRMEVRHVLDFLNQMALLASHPRLIGDRVVLWLPFPEDLSPAENAPRLISVRPLYEPQEPQHQYGVGIVFDDGYFALVPFVLHGSLEGLGRRWKDIRVDDNGDLYISPGHIVRAGELYARCFGPRTAGPGVFSPAFRIG